MTGVIEKKSAYTPLEKRFGRLGERNIKAMETAYEQVATEEK
jgi:Pyruvate/2-oxoacid:ferredoxin oxidoreductase gamma subunit